MCGIIGIVTNDHRTDWTAAVNCGIAALSHRGPDDRGVVCVPERRDPLDMTPLAVIGNVRLAVLDLSPSGHMPMASPDGKVWITYNGELFNYLDLRVELEAVDRTFASRGDTEVVLHAYLEWGDACLPRLNGMFAFAIVDRREPSGDGRRPGMRCLIARDPLGVKPCYYVEGDGSLAFASEIKGLAALGQVTGEPDWQALWDYFSYLYIPGPATAYGGVRQLPPAHCLVWEYGRNAPELRRYWSPLPGVATPPAGNEREAAGELRGLLTDAIHRQLVSDVPLGVFLSGGIDSTILAAVAAASVPGRLKTFTVVFEGEGIATVDDREHARRVSRRYGTEHTELTVNLSHPEEIFALAGSFDQPFANPTFYLSHLISAHTREHVTVALSGAGGDELFGGYPRYRALPYAGALRALPAPLGRLAARAIETVVPENYDNPLRRRLLLFLRGAGRSLPEQYLRWTYYFDDDHKRRLLAPVLARHGEFAPSARHLAQRLDAARGLADIGNRIQYADLETFLADNILEYTDRTSMAVSLEVRVPFLDKRVVEWSFRRPFREKLAAGESKRLLRRAFRDLIPPENLAAPKRGFCPPLAAWMAGPLDRYFDEFMAPEAVVRAGIFDWREIQALRETHRARRRDFSMELFGIIMFDVWWRQFIQHNR